MSSEWERWHDWNASMMRPITDWTCQALAAPGRTLLDTACGTGLPSLALAERIGPTGTLIAVDISEDMIAIAKRKAAGAGLSRIDHRQMDLHALDFPDAHFDGVSCSYALMFSADPVKALSELRRVLKPNARVACVVWDEPEKNPYLTSVFGTLGRFVPRPAPDPRAPGPFRLAPKSELESALGAAGLREVNVQSREMIFEFESVAQHWQITADMAAPLRMAAANMPAVEVEKLKAALADAIAPYVEHGRVRIPTASLCAVGVR